MFNSECLIGLCCGDIILHDKYGELTILSCDWNNLGYHVIMKQKLQVFIPFIKVVKHCRIVP